MKVGLEGVKKLKIWERSDLLVRRPLHNILEKPMKIEVLKYC